MKILCSDFDNTLFFSEDKKKTEKNIASIKKFISKGNVFCIITGRSYMEIKKDLKEINVPYTYLICADGAMIFDSKDNCIQKINIDASIVESILSILTKEGYDAYLEDGYNITTNINNCIKISSLYATTKEAGIEITKRISKEFDVYAYASRKHININNKLNDKKQALLRLAELQHFEHKDFYVIGDDVNDCEMLEEFESAIVERHNPMLDNKNIPVYKTLSDYIAYLMTN